MGLINQEESYKNLTELSSAQWHAPPMVHELISRGTHVRDDGMRMDAYTAGHTPMMFHRLTSTAFIATPSSPRKLRSFSRKYVSLY